MNTATLFGKSGMWYCHVQARDLAGNESIIKTVSVNMIKNNMPESIMSAEYFFDNDPGIGNGIVFIPKDGNFDHLTEIIDLDIIDISDLDSGLHTFSIRARDSKNRWGPTKKIPFWKNIFQNLNKPPIAKIFGKPASPSNDSNVILSVGGDGATYYKYKINNEAYSHEYSVAKNITLGHQLIEGRNTLSVIVRDDLGNWQSIYQATSISWILDTTPPVINGLSHDNKTTIYKTWTWSANETSSFRYRINQTSDSIITDSFYDVNTASIKGKNGIWYCHVQARDIAGNESEIVSVTAILKTETFPESIAAAEYFVDVDPGEGKGTSIIAKDSIFDNLTEQFLLNEINISDLPHGIHKIFFRGKDSNNRWGPPQSSVFFVNHVGDTIIPPKALISGKPDSPTNSTIANFTIHGERIKFYKYKLDGNEYSKEYEISKTITLDNLLEGKQTLSVIACDENGIWQTIDNATTTSWIIDQTPPIIYNLSDTIDPVLNKTWKWDSEKSARFRYKINANPDCVLTGNYQHPQTASITGKNGKWYLHVQAIDIAGNESPVTTVFVNLYTVSPESIISAEYFFDTDPGEGNGFYFLPKDNLYDSTFETFQMNNLNLSNLSSGVHTIFFRAKDNEDRWGPVKGKSFWLSTPIQDTIPPEALLTNYPDPLTNENSANIAISGDQITHYRYQLNNDSYSIEFKINEIINLRNLNDGKHVLSVIAKDAAGNWQEEENSTTIEWIVDTTPPTITGISNDTHFQTQKVWNWDAVDSSKTFFRYQIDQNETWSNPSIPFSDIQTASLENVTGKWFLHVQSKDEAGNTSDIKTVYVIINDSDIIMPPYELQAKSLNSRSIKLLWEEQFLSNISHYNVYRSDEENGLYLMINAFPVYDIESINSAFFQRYVDNELIPNKIYWYKVSSKSTDGRESHLSNPVSIKPQKIIEGDFRMLISESSKVVSSGNITSFTINIVSIDEFGQEVFLKATSINLSSQVVFRFSHEKIQPTGTTTLQVQVPFGIEPGNYSIKVDALSDRRSHEVYLDLKIVSHSLGESFLSISSDKSKYLLNETVKIKGQLIPVPYHAKEIQISLKPPFGDWIIYPAVIDNKGSYHLEYQPGIQGQYLIKSLWIGHQDYAKVESENVDFYVGKGKSKLVCSTTSKNIMPGETIDIMINLEPGISEEPLILEIHKPGKEVFDKIEGLYTLEEGKRHFIYNLDVNLPGVWKFKAIWKGNNDYLGSISLPLVLYPGIETGEALIVAGGGSTNYLWKTTRNLANSFYLLLKQRRFTHDSIMYISDESHDIDLDNDGNDDILIDDNDPSVEDIRCYIENLANQSEIIVGNNLKTLTIYLVDHGDYGQFIVNKGERLNAENLDQWLDDLQDKTNCKILLIVEACHSGTFINQLYPENDQERILISSSGTELSNYNYDGELSFSKLLFEKIYEGNNIKLSFDKAFDELKQMSFFQSQTPEFYDGKSGEIASEFYVGGTGLFGFEKPEIISSTPAQSIDSGNFPILIELSAQDNIDQVFVNIIPPNYTKHISTGLYESETFELNNVFFNNSNKSNIYQINYDFQCSGGYILTYYVKDESLNVTTKEIVLDVQGEKICHIPGDIDNNGFIGIEDVLLLLMIECSIVQDNNTLFINADIDGDNRIGMQEIIFILEVIANIHN